MVPQGQQPHWGLHVSLTACRFLDLGQVISALRLIADGIYLIKLRCGLNKTMHIKE